MIKNGIVHKGAPKCIKPNYNNKKRNRKRGIFHSLNSHSWTVRPTC